MLNRLIICITLVLIASPLVADTLVHNIKGYTTTEEGLLTFQGLLYDDNGKVIQTSIKPPLTNY